MKNCSLIFLVLYSIPALSQDEVLIEGNQSYKNGNYEAAESRFRQLSTDPRARFNLGNTYYRQNRLNEATVVFTDLANDNSEASIRSRAYYNYGVILTGEGKLEESIEAYKNALRLDPNDTQARENMQKAILELRKKNPPPPKKEPPKKKPPQPKMNNKQAEQKLKQLQDKQKQTQQKIQQKQPVSTQPRDW